MRKTSNLPNTFVLGCSCGLLGWISTPFLFMVNLYCCFHLLLLLRFVVAIAVLYIIKNILQKIYILQLTNYEAVLGARMAQEPQCLLNAKIQGQTGKGPVPERHDSIQDKQA